MSNPKFRYIAPQFVVPDVVRSAEYYRDKLGFEILGYFLDPPVYAMVRRGDVEIHFGKGDGEQTSRNVDIRKGSMEAYVFVTRVHQLYDELIAAGVDVPYPPTTRVYDRTEIEIIDCDGHKLVFGE
jgi:catechol 2,3-dioxygenase-like lactoylglutathione lyase family enzyme